ncbi:hypothetical protein [Prescottella agglutinans]|uniref:hypothetical protein n=1 Tax=Prescottella agglutinans TaxID=1644129 RepID=UPI00247557D4|nr:hypothetical protein [Prescottella agglutinans]
MSADESHWTVASSETALEKTTSPDESWITAFVPDFPATYVPEGDSCAPAGRAAAVVVVVGASAVVDSIDVVAVVVVGFVVLVVACGVVVVVVGLVVVGLVVVGLVVVRLVVVGLVVVVGEFDVVIGADVADGVVPDGVVVVVASGVIGVRTCIAAACVAALSVEFSLGGFGWLCAPPEQ